MTELLDAVRALPDWALAVAIVGVLALGTAGERWERWAKGGER
jgi:hypothetical protein